MTEGNGDLESVSRALSGVVLGEPLAQAIGFDAHNGVGVLIEGLAALENLDADRILLDLGRLSGKELLAKIGKQVGEPRCARELRRGKHGAQFSTLCFDFGGMDTGCGHFAFVPRSLGLLRRLHYSAKDLFANAVTVSCPAGERV